MIPQNFRPTNSDFKQWIDDALNGVVYTDTGASDAVNTLLQSIAKSSLLPEPVPQSLIDAAKLLFEQDTKDFQ